MEIKELNIQSMDYPQKLREIYNPPKKLYYIGDIKILNNFCIGIVGSRLSTKYGNDVAMKFANKLSNLGITVVSGLAYGIDRFAHLGSINEKGKTIAVLGSGIDIIYPYTNKDIYEEIIKQNGLIITEFENGTKPLSINFPMRNRIISGISDGLLVVEAKKRSGTSITVDYALEQGKNVFAIPGNINSSCSEGTNELIKQGAKLTTSVFDILEEYC